MKTARGWGIFGGEFCRESTQYGNWKRLQMLNELRFGGHGFSANLVPGPHQANQDHKHKWEIPADDALGPKSETYDPTKHRVAWLQADISYWTGEEFERKYDPPIVRGESPKKHWYAREITFTSGQYIKNRKNEWVPRRPKTKLVPDFTLTEKALPLPDWSLAKVPPINTGDRSEFQMKATKRINDVQILSDDLSKEAFAANGGWKHLDKRRKERPFEKWEDVIKFLKEVQREKRPEKIDFMIRALDKLYLNDMIRLNG